MTFDVHIAFDGLSGVDGSARFSFSTTTALASVSGPIAARLAAEHPVRATIDLHVRPIAAVPGTPEKHAGVALKGIFERACVLARHPRTSIQIVVQALSYPSHARGVRGGGVDADTDVLLAAEIDACSLALLNAGSVPMRGVVCAVAVARPTSTNPPELLAEEGGHAQVEQVGCFAFLFGVDGTRASAEAAGAGGLVPPSKMIWTNYRARLGSAFTPAELAEAERVALEGATAVWIKMKEALGASSFAGDGLP